MGSFDSSNLSQMAVNFARQAAAFDGQDGREIEAWWTSIREHAADVPPWVFEEAFHYVSRALVAVGESRRSHRLSKEFNLELEAYFSNSSNRSANWLNAVGSIAASVNEIESRSLQTDLSNETGRGLLETIDHRNSTFDLSNHGVFNIRTEHWNLTAAPLYEATLAGGLGRVSADGALVVETGKYTGRSPRDKFIVKEPSSQDNICWGPINEATTPECFENLHRRMLSYYQGRELFVQDLYVGADLDYRLPIRVITENPWLSLFARNNFIEPQTDELKNFVPELTVLSAPNFRTVPERDGTNSECALMMNFAESLILAAGSLYSGEIKKAVFSYLSYLMPDRNVLPMNCSANIGSDGNVSIFFGLSGTGKTTLSTDGNRALIGTAEHGWSANGIFNFEGGCYAKVINLSEEAEPEIYAATRRFGTILENVVMDPLLRTLDLDDGSLTENTRASYPIDFIPNICESGNGGHPTNIVMLTADAFGVLPPISQLTAEQAMYHFLSGYTSRVTGTERGVIEPMATFSTCFGAPFMPRHPSVYAMMLARRIKQTGAKCWLVNTGWSGGAFGTGQRMKIGYTRSMLNAALDGRLAEIGVSPDPNFGVLVPASCPDVPAEILQPRTTWADKKAYDTMARDLRSRFQNNFKQFELYVNEDVKAAGVQAAA